jgi:hypothetical protein
VYTEADFPANWGMANLNLGEALRDLGELDGSIAAFERAVRGFEIVGDAEKAEDARSAAEKSRRMKDSMPRRFWMALRRIASLLTNWARNSRSDR